MLREIVEDLEWPGGPLVITLDEATKKLQMSAQGSGALEVCYVAYCAHNIFLLDLLSSYKVAM